MAARLARERGRGTASVGAFAVVAAGAYYATWRLLTGLNAHPLWLPALWVLETYVLVSVLLPAMEKTSTNPTAERRGLSRTPVAMPIRYSSEDGHVGIGLLVDITERGAGLLVPRGAAVADRVWIQFLWLDARVSIPAHTVFVLETTHGLRAGLELGPLLADTSRFLAMMVLPSGAHTQSETKAPALLPTRWRLWPRRRPDPPRRVPVEASQGHVKVWAVGEMVRDRFVALLAPRALAEGEVALAPWGGPQKHEATILRVETLKPQPLPLFHATLANRE